MYSSVPIQKSTILVIDDLPHNLRLLESLLTNQGYEVRLASSGKLAIASLNRFNPDLIMLDILMPEMDGYAVCKQLKSNPETAHIPVIFISALGEGLDKAEAFHVGGADYITKPFQVEEVLARVKHQLKLVNLTQQLKQRNQELEITNNKLQETLIQLERLVNIDGLTQVANRRYFDETLTKEWQHHQASQSCLALLFCDVDHFKQYNDFYGHQQGDECLIQIAHTLSQVAQNQANLVARYGGEEFAVILTQTPPTDLATITDLIHQALRELQLPHANSVTSDYVTLSIGAVSRIPQPESSATDLIAQSDRALYLAKSQGRNQTVILP